MERDSEHPAPAAPLVKVIDLAPGAAEAAQHLAQADQMRDDLLRQIARAFAVPLAYQLGPKVTDLCAGHRADLAPQSVVHGRQIAPGADRGR